MNIKRRIIINLASSHSTSLTKSSDIRVLGCTYEKIYWDAILNTDGAHLWIELWLWLILLFLLITLWILETFSYFSLKRLTWWINSYNGSLF